KEKRNAYYKEMMRCLGAPHLICLHLDRGFDPYALMDVGIILQTIALLAVERGLGTCILAQAIRYPGVVRKHSAIPNGDGNGHWPSYHGSSCQYIQKREG
ncbi:MAG: nitroreductase family protein, partial [Deltaproteobacteria bacterium]|nr:nitroreductase family protein [Deltaproteobacteria bacterium]